jgi:hypothetical protein
MILHIVPTELRRERCGHSIWYTTDMTKHEVNEVLDRVHSWPEERREEAARILLEMEAQDASPYRLSDEQLAEVQRRRAKQDPKLIPLADARKRFMRLGV